MTEKEHKACLGYNEACTKDFRNILGDIAYAAEAGFEEIELRFDCIESFLQAGGSLELLGQSLKEHGLRQGPVNALYLYPGLFTEDDGKEEHAEFHARLNLLREMHASIGTSQVIAVAPLLKNRREAAVFSKHEAFDMCVTALKRLCLDLPEICFIFEPVGLERSLVRDADFAKEIIDAVACENIGLVLDSCNLFLKNLSSDFDFSALNAADIKAVHLMNGIMPDLSREILDQSWRRFLDDGDAVDTDLFLQRLAESSYVGMISTEVFNEEYERNLSQQQIIERAAVSLKQALIKNAWR